MSEEIKNIVKKTKLVKKLVTVKKLVPVVKKVEVVKEVEPVKQLEVIPDNIQEIIKEYKELNDDSEYRKMKGENLV